MKMHVLTCTTNLKPNLNASANLNANVNPPLASYAIFSYLFQLLIQFLVLAFGTDVICMIRLIPTITVIHYY
jgi:hypothetical protein